VKPEEEPVKPDESQPPPTQTVESSRDQEVREAASLALAARQREAEMLHDLVEAPCTPHITAQPTRNLLAPENAWNGTDSGPVIPAYVTLSGGAVRSHGVDISRYQQNAIHYDRLRECGTQFAFVKMDQVFHEHANHLRAREIQVIPYHYLTVRGSWRGRPMNFVNNPSIFGDGATEAELLSAAREVGRGQAQAFLTKYNAEIPEQHREQELPGLRGQLIALDVEEVFNNERHRGITTEQRIGYGRFYAAALAQWVQTVRTAHPNAIIVFYTFPDVFASYLSHAQPADYAIVNSLPVWVAQTGDRRGLDLSSRSGNSGRSLQALCLSNGVGNRCIFHQYTHRGLFAAIQPPDADFTTRRPNTHDVNRYLGAQAVVTEFGTAFVRPVPGSVSER
jgi:hypothetical protein